jgi:hypothetical protein
MPRLSSLDEYDNAVKAHRVADNTTMRLHTLWREWQDKRDRLAVEADAAWAKVQADLTPEVRARSGAGGRAR